MSRGKKSVVKLSQAVAQGVVDPFDDMHDNPGGAVSPLPPGACDPILERFDAVDQRAGSYRRRYGLCSLLTASCGAGAVILAILELGHDRLQPLLRESRLGRAPELLARIELIAVIVMVLSWLGMLTLKSKWLARRHQAERYRQIKYQLLIGPEKWNDRGWLTHVLALVEEYEPGINPWATFSLLEQAISRAPRVPFDIEKKMLPRNDLRRLLNYYLEKRMTPQMEYLEKRTRSNRIWKIVFLGSELLLSVSAVGAVIYAASILEDPIRATWFLLAAACCPVIAANLRTLRASFEFSRNQSRFEAAHAALVKLKADLDHDLNTLPDESDHSRVDASGVLKRLHWSEHLLTTEHVEWLRLMIETELFA